MVGLVIGINAGEVGIAARVHGDEPDEGGGDAPHDGQDAVLFAVEAAAVEGEEERPAANSEPTKMSRPDE